MIRLSDRCSLLSRSLIFVWNRFVAIFIDVRSLFFSVILSVIEFGWLMSSCNRVISSLFWCRIQLLLWRHQRLFTLTLQASEFCSWNMWSVVGSFMPLGILLHQCTPSATCPNCQQKAILYLPLCQWFCSSVSESMHWNLTLNSSWSFL